MILLYKRDIPDNVLSFIRIQTSLLIRTGYFQYTDRDDLQQDLALFYLEKLLPQNNAPISEGLLFIAIKNQALDILRKKRRALYYARTNEQHALADESFSKINESALDAKMIVGKILSDLNPRERDVCVWQCNFACD